MKKMAEAMGIVLTDEQVAQFDIYQTLLIEWNERINLTSIIAPNEIVIRHFLDSLSCAEVMGDLNGKAVIDVGTGAGFPGLPLKLLFPEMRLTLTDSVGKKTRFLAAVVEALALTDVTIIAERAEAMGQDRAHRETYDWAVARAVARLPILAEYLLPLVRVGGSVLAQKGQTAQDEIDAADYAIKRLGGGRPTLSSVQLPNHDRLHYLIKIPKVKRTPKTYPRRVGLPSQNPLGRDVNEK